MHNQDYYREGKLGLIQGNKIGVLHMEKFSF